MLPNEFNRRTFLGATDIGAIMGIHPYRTALSVALEKQGKSAWTPTTPVMQRGMDMEPYVAGIASQAANEPLMKATWTSHQRYPHLAASPDYIGTISNELHEIKTHQTWLRSSYGPRETDVPPYEAVQLLWQMHICRGECADVGHLDVAFVDENARVLKGKGMAVPVGLVDFQQFRVEYDADVARNLEEFALAWWQKHVVEGALPDVTDADLSTIAALYPFSEVVTVTATPEIEETVARLKDARVALKTSEKEVDGLVARIQAHMGVANRMDSSHGPFSWTTVMPQDKREADFSLLATEYPDAYAACVTTKPAKPYRRFTTPREWRDQNDG